MAHLGERITEFVFSELSASEMEEARRHVAVCAECRDQVQQFERTRSVLKMSPDVDPPRNIVFEVENPRPMTRWFIPVAVAAAMLVGVLVASPVQIQWHDSQLTIAFGKAPAPPPAVVAPANTPPAVVQPVDYERIEKDVASSQQAWLINQLKKRDAAQLEQIRRLQDQLVYMDAKQRAIELRGVENTSTLQYLAQRSGDQN